MPGNAFDYREFARLPTRHIRHIPGDSGSPLVGDSLRFLRDFSDLTRDKYQRYGPVFRVNALFQHTIVLLGPEANEAVLKDPEKCFSNALAWNPTLDRIFPNGQMLMDFDEHKYHRRVLQAALREQYLAAEQGQLGLHFAEVQAKLFLYQLLTRYEVSVEPGYRMANSVVPLSLPTDGLPVTLRRLRKPGGSR